MATGGVKAALEEFVAVIDAVGGVVEHRNGSVAPAIDMGWSDLGACYVKACRALGRELKMAPSGFDSAKAAEGHVLT